MASELETEVRNMDDPSRPLNQNAREIAERLRANYNTVHGHLVAKRQGYESHTAYVRYWDNRTRGKRVIPTQ